MNYLICPKCGDGLSLDNRRLICSQNHSYDIARQGYANLLLANQKKSKQPGDGADMVEARVQFLNQGYYQPIADLLNENIPTATRILDIGCGEGYYTHQVAQQQPGSTSITGLDISRDAVKKACRLNKSIQWIVASGVQPPVEEQSFDCIISLFTPLMPKGFDHALAENGEVLCIYTGAQHLLELRELIYDQVQEERYDPIPEMRQAGFECIEQAALNFSFQLNSSEMIKHLFMMTPHRWKTTPEKIAKLEQLNQLDTQADVILYRFKRA